MCIYNNIYIYPTTVALCKPSSVFFYTDTSDISQMKLLLLLTQRGNKYFKEDFGTVFKGLQANPF